MRLEKNTERIIVPKYKSNNIHDELKAHIKNRFALLNTIHCQLEQCGLETDITKEECKKNIPIVKKKMKPRWMIEEILKIIKDRKEAKVKCDKRLISSMHLFNKYYHRDRELLTLFKEIEENNKR